MIIPGKKKAFGIMISKLHKDSGMKDSSVAMKNEESIDEKSEALHSHAQSMIDAIHSKSPADLVEAMKSFLEEHDLHEASESKEEEKAEHSILGK
jgi:hypothetical protein